MIIPKVKIIIGRNNKNINHCNIFLPERDFFPRNAFYEITNTTINKHLSNFVELFATLNNDISKN